MIHWIPCVIIVASSFLTGYLYAHIRLAAQYNRIKTILNESYEQKKREAVRALDTANQVIAAAEGLVIKINTDIDSVNRIHHAINHSFGRSKAMPTDAN